MTHKNSQTVPDSSAVRVALWRALHLQVEDSPPILVDRIGLQLASPEQGWELRPDMHPQGTMGYRASIVGRSRYIEDLVVEKYSQGVRQYVILGAGLDTFAQRRPETLKDLRIFEVDKPDTQKWKQRRLKELGYEIPETLNFVSVDFEGGESWIDKLMSSGFDKNQPSVIVSTGVSMYLTKDANKETLIKIASLATGSVFAMTFILTLDLIDPNERGQHQMVYKKAKEAGTPFLSFYTPNEIQALAVEVGFKKVEHISRDDLIKLYFTNRSDGFQPSSGEDFLIATI
ncbi:MAG: class I SAM-dependent methyltransferase [Bdellovibrionales bacterium]|nr:class I SAM-dependent methyltransferase [Bdellovibrionales bacterium]